MNADSIDKIVTSYFAAVTTEPFTYKKKVYRPHDIVVSPLLFCGFTCPIKCGGCCPRFSLDYLPSESGPAILVERQVEFNGKSFTVLSDMQSDHSNHHCRNLDKDTGRCGIYEHRPFTCDFELIRFLHFSDKSMLTQKLFGRGWALTRIDGGKGALYTMTTPDENTHADARRKLARLAEWLAYFEVKSVIADILRWVDEGGGTEPLTLPARREKGLFV